MSPQLHDNRHQVVRGGGVEALAPFPFEPNFIDWRTSRGRADRRAQADDETLEICMHCECEVDVAQPMHRPNCAGIGAPRASSATVVSLPAPEKKVAVKHLHSSDAPCRVPGCKWQARQDEPDGLDLLERMDAGMPPNDDPEVLEEVPEAERLGPDGTGTSSSTGAEPELGAEEAAAVGDFTESGTAGGGPSSEPERAAATSSNPYGLKKFGRGYIWTKDAAIAAVQAFARAHGRPPQVDDSRGPGAVLPSKKSTGQLFDNWGAMVSAAGLEPAKPNAPRAPRAKKIRGAARAADEQAEPTTRPAPSQAERPPEPNPMPAPARSADPPPAPTRDHRADRGRTRLRRHPRSGARA